MSWALFSKIRTIIPLWVLTLILNDLQLHLMRECLQKSSLDFLRIWAIVLWSVTAFLMGKYSQFISKGLEDLTHIPSEIYNKSNEEYLKESSLYFLWIRLIFLWGLFWASSSKIRTILPQWSTALFNKEYVQKTSLEFFRLWFIVLWSFTAFLIRNMFTIHL